MPHLSGRPRAALLLVAGALALAACDDSDNGGSPAAGIQTLGNDFVRAFLQDPDDVPLDASALTLTLTPEIEPFDP